MNVADILKIVPNEVTEEGEYDKETAEANVAGPSSSKRARLDDQQPSTSALIDSLESQAGGSSEGEFNAAALKRIWLQFDRKVKRNQEMRIKYADSPQKFMESELELFDVLKEMHIIATQPSLYGSFIELGGVSTLLSLLTHENTDVACAVVELLQELTDFEDVSEIEGVGQLIEVLIENQITVLLVNNMDRLNESVKEEADGIHNSLEIVENLTDYDPKLTKDVKPLLLWILKKLRTKPVYYPNKLYASEILSILLQNNEENKTLLGTVSGIDVLLKVISVSLLFYFFDVTLILCILVLQETRPRDDGRGRVHGKLVQLPVLVVVFVLRQSSPFLRWRRHRVDEFDSQRKAQERLEHKCAHLCLEASQPQPGHRDGRRAAAHVLRQIHPNSRPSSVDAHLLEAFGHHWTSRQETSLAGGTGRGALFVAHSRAASLLQTRKHSTGAQQIHRDRHGEDGEAGGVASQVLRQATRM